MAQKDYKIKYLKAYDYRAAVATGIYGGITSNGLINGNFFIDRTVIPDYETIKLDDNGVAQGIPIPTKDSDFVREILFGVLMDINTARLVHTWIGEKIKEYDKVVEKKVS